MGESLVHRAVADCMSTTLVTVGPYDSLAQAWEQMSRSGIRRLPVVENGELRGILTLTDLLALREPDPTHRRSLAEVAAELDRLVVSTAMSRDPVCVYANDTVGRAAELMLEHKVGGLPVLDLQGRLCGVVTESDLFALMARQWRDDNLVFSGARPH